MNTCSIIHMYFKLAIANCKHMNGCAYVQKQFPYSAVQFVFSAKRGCTQTNNSFETAPSALSLWRNQDLFAFVCEWHLPAIAQFAQLHPHELFPAFLSLIITITARAISPPTTASMIMFTQLAASHSTIQNTFNSLLLRQCTSWQV